MRRWTFNIIAGLSLGLCLLAALLWVRSHSVKDTSFHAEANGPLWMLWSFQGAAGLVRGDEWPSHRASGYAAWNLTGPLEPPDEVIPVFTNRSISREDWPLGVRIDQGRVRVPLTDDGRTWTGASLARLGPADTNPFARGTPGGSMKYVEVSAPYALLLGALALIPSLWLYTRGRTRWARWQHNRLGL